MPAEDLSSKKPTPVERDRFGGRPPESRPRQRPVADRAPISSAELTAGTADLA